jgi:signal transduction histidine kinase
MRGRGLIPYARATVIGGFALVLVAGVGSGIMALRAADADHLVAHTLEQIQAAGALLGDMQDAETGQRGFLLTGDPGYLQPFINAQASTPRTLARLRELTTDEAGQRERLSRITPLVEAKLNELRLTIALAREGRSKDAINRVKTHQGKLLMDRIRVEVAGFSQSELEMLGHREREAAAARTSLLILIGFSLLAALGLAAFLSRQSTRSLHALATRTRELEAETALRRDAEAILRQSQKMESIGQLAGGIAHDFNNVLTVILGSLDTIQRRIDNSRDEASQRDLAATLVRPVELALQGVRSATQLTQRLLAFSRRQTLAPTRLDLNHLVSGMSELLRRTLGEAIEIQTVLAGGLWPTLADANQVENALLNLCVNAQHAMPNGGRLTIETSNAHLDEEYVRPFGDVAAGQYLLLSVSDTGTGIPPDILDRVFEPFFTTRSGADGSGLGLAMVHGFVKQSGGHIRIYSEVNQGTAVKIYLPRLLQAAQASSPSPRIEPSADAPRAEAGETILVVEDNPGVRAFARATLEELGYRVIEAGDAEDALRAVDQAHRVDLLFTDVVLPGVNGRELSRKILELRGDLPVLFTTGYTRNAIIHHGRLDPDVRLLPKPYTQRMLAQELRTLLDATRPPDAGID